MDAQAKHETVPLWDGTQTRFRFSNGYGASVVCHEFSYGGREGFYEIAVLDRNGEITYSTPITGDVLGWIPEIEIDSWLQQIAALEQN